MLSIEACYELLLRWAVLSCAVGGSATIALWLTREPARRISIIQGTFVGLALLPLLMIAPGYPRLAVLPSAELLNDGGQAGDAKLAELHNATVDSPPHPDPLPRGEREILLPSPLVGEGGLRSKPGEGGTAGTALSQEHSHAQLSMPSPAAPLAAAPPHPDPLPRGEREKTGHAWSYRDAIVAAYLTGLVLMFGWTALGLAAVWRLLRSARPVPLECRILLKSLGGPRTERVALVVSPRVAQPCAVAGWRTTIVLPVALVHQQNPQALRWALAHEWSHVERHDLPWWLASGLVRAVYFYQPLVWWLRGQLQLSQDFLADGAAAGLSNSPEDYAEFLTTSSFTRPTLAAGLGIGGRISDLQRRVVMLVDRRRPLERVSPRSWNLATIVAVMLVVGVAAGLAPEEPRPESGGGSAKEAATQADSKPAPSPTPAPTAAPAGGTLQPTPLASPSLEPTPASEEKPSRAAKFNPTPDKRRVPDLSPAVPDGIIEMQLRKDPEIEMLLRRAADLEARLIGARSTESPDRAVVEKQLNSLNELIEKRKTQLRPQLVQSLSAERVSQAPVTAPLGAPALLAPAVPDAKRKIQPGDVLSVVVLDNLDQLPALGTRLLLYPKMSEVIATVDSEGEILLGTRYGTVKVVDMTLLQASAFVSNVIQEYIQMRGQQERQRLLKSETTDADKKVMAQAITDALGRLEVNVRVSLAGTGPERTPVMSNTYNAATVGPVYPLNYPVTAPPSAPAAMPPSGPDAKRKIHPGEVLIVEVVGDDGVKPFVFAPFQIEPDGNIALGARYGRLRVADLSPIEAEAALEKHFKHSGVAKGAVKAQVTLDTHLYVGTPVQHERIRPGDPLNIEVIPRDADIGSALVQPDGSIGLGVRYGRVNVAGQTLAEAAHTVKESVAKLFPNAEVQVTYPGPRPLSATIGTPVAPATATPAGPTVAPYLPLTAASPPDTIMPGDVLNIESWPEEAKVKPVVTVEPDGRIALGVRYGRVHVGGKSLSEAEQIVQKVVAEMVQDPQVQITFERRGRY